MWNFQIFAFLVLLSILESSKADRNCTELKERFASATAEFNSCAIQNSRPVTFCENCVNDYIEIVDSYNDMKEVSDNGTYCVDTLINLDRLQIVQTLYTNSYNLWNNAKCYECFQVVDGKLTPNKSLQTIAFNKYYETFMQCINHSVNDTTLCPTCIKDYLDLDNYYRSISNENEKIGGCMDMVDLINNTRQFWSQKCCKYRRRDEYIFLASTITVLIVTLLFYVIVQFSSVRKTPAIMQQTRFAESLSHNSHS
ncbi:osteopetrosis-associated transmembrane protein 1-like [Tribolium madens]|uniref:osteopetrosis-associated transmembrane protein 1-like n=1 Tax=Tribolium madens TaxID=41895 RepID=UPI001CF76607|nr:osteopetrosis-associated transmembrane protein 1-like [Tribolium madens]